MSGKRQISTAREAEKRRAREENQRLARIMENMSAEIRSDIEEKQGTQ